jgi:hypothetical protein
MDTRGGTRRGTPRGGTRPRKKYRVGRPSDSGSVSSAASMNGPKFIDSKGNVKLTKLPSHHSKLTPEQVAAALLLKPTSSEAVGVVILSKTLKNEFVSRCNCELASKRQQVQAKTAHLERLNASLGCNTATMLKLHEENKNIQARLTACHRENTHLQGQKERVQDDLVAIQDELLVHQSILELINLTDESKQILPFQTLSLTEVAARLGISSWGDIVSLSFNATHRATLVCDVLGLGQNSEFISLWRDPPKPDVWLHLFGSKPVVETGRKTNADEMKVRLAGYLRIDPPDNIVDGVLGNLLDDDSGSLSSVAEGDEGEESDKEEGPIPGSVDVSSSRSSSLKAASEEDLMAELQRRKRKAASLNSDVEDGKDKAASSDGDDGKDKAASDEDNNNTK